MIHNDDVDNGPLRSRLHKTCPCPQLCLPCNTLFRPLRNAVSQNKVRFKQDGFDLDLAYVTDRIIVHGFPAVGLEHLYRNPRLEIRRFLDTRHPERYKVFNFCCEPGRGYPPETFHGRSERFPFKDHGAPPFKTIVDFTNSAKDWLEQDEENVVTLHCKAGKGRAGLMCCVLLLRLGLFDTAKDAIAHYDSKRVTKKKALTVTTQIKYVHYFEKLWRDVWKIPGNIGDVSSAEARAMPMPREHRLNVTRVELVNLRHDYSKSQLFVEVLRGTPFKPILLHRSGNGTGTWDVDIVVEGNVCIGIGRRGRFGKRKKFFQLWFNSAFVDPDGTTADYGRNELDLPKSDKGGNVDKIAEDFFIRISFGVGHIRPLLVDRDEAGVPITPQAGKTPQGNGYARGEVEMVVRSAGGDGARL